MTIPGELAATAYGVPRSARMHCDMCGIRAPVATPHLQQRRAIKGFVCFAVTRGRIALRDELPEGSEEVRVPAGWIHIIAPGLYQTGIEAFPVGSVFRWFHLVPEEPYRILDRSAVLSSAARERGEREWLIPRHLELGESEAAFIADHDDLLESTRIDGIDDPATQVIAARLLQRLHERCLQRALHGDHAGLDAATLHALRARRLIRHRVGEPWSLTSVAAEFGLDPAYLARCYRQVHSLSVGDAIAEAKVAHAKQLLRHGLSVKETAASCGFASANYFCRLFRRHTGTSPKRFATSTA